MRPALELILGASRELYPREFNGQLRMEGDTITEVLVIPKSVWGKGFAQTRMDFIPIDETIQGSVHSHPSERNTPSKADLRYFKKKGRVHLIVAQPAQSITDIAAYDREGNTVELRLD